MLEVMGRVKVKFDQKKMRLLHGINGYLFVILFIILSYYCLPFLKAGHVEKSARALIHSLFAIGVIMMLSVKIIFIRVYKKFMSKAPIFGLTIFFIVFGVVASSGIYYLVISAESSDASNKKTETKIVENIVKSTKIDQNKVKNGKQLFNKWCIGCHDTGNTQKTGPGMGGILKNKLFPVSGRPATVENIRRQIITPYRMMPPHTHLKDNEIVDIIEFLKTL